MFVPVTMLFGQNAYIGETRGLSNPSARPWDMREGTRDARFEAYTSTGLVSPTNVA